MDESKYPVAYDKAKVGTYPWWTHAGGGLRYDKLLEFRVWFSVGSKAHVKAFPTAEAALRYRPLGSAYNTHRVCLVSQDWWISEEPGEPRYRVNSSRVTEWPIEYAKSKPDPEWDKLPLRPAGAPVHQKPAYVPPAPRVH